MISKSQVKHIRSLDDKKNRYEYKQFVVEGDKMLAELLQSDFEIIGIYAIAAWAQRQSLSAPRQALVTEISLHDLERISRLKTPNEVLAVVAFPAERSPDTGGKMIALDNIQDPGNLGTIIRIADWYGIDTVLCNTHTADVYNSKVLQATMGSIFRVYCHYTDLQVFFEQHTATEKYACVLGGENVNTHKKVKEGIIVIGNESKGIDERLTALCGHRISIPKKGHAESLNAAVATGIICNTLFV